MLNSKTVTIRDAAILTTSYVASIVLDQVENYNQLNLYCYFTKGSLTTAEVKVEFSIDGTNYAQQSMVTSSAGVGTVNKFEYQTAEDGNVVLSLPISARFIKVSAKGTGTVSSSSLKIDAFLHSV